MRPELHVERSGAILAKVLQLRLSPNQDHYDLRLGLTERSSVRMRTPGGWEPSAVRFPHSAHDWLILKLKFLVFAKILVPTVASVITSTMTRSFLRDSIVLQTFYTRYGS